MPSLPGPAPSSEDRGQEGAQRVGAYRPPRQEAAAGCPGCAAAPQRPIPQSRTREIRESGPVHEAGAPRQRTEHRGTRQSLAPSMAPCPPGKTAQSEASGPVQSLSWVPASLTSGLVPRDGPSTGSHAAGLTLSAWHIPVQSAEPLIRSLTQQEHGRQPSSGSREHSGSGDRARRERGEGRRAESRFRQRHQEPGRHEPRRDEAAARDTWGRGCQGDGASSHLPAPQTPASGARRTAERLSGIPARLASHRLWWTRNLTLLEGVPRSRRLPWPEPAGQAPSPRSTHLSNRPQWPKLHFRLLLPPPALLLSSPAT